MKNIVYVENKDIETQIDRIKKYCITEQITIHEIVTNIDVLLELCGKKNISNLIILNLESLGDCTRSRLEIINKLKQSNKNSKLHIIDLYFTFGKKDINQVIPMNKTDSCTGIGYFMLTMISAFMDLGNEIVNKEEINQ